MKSRLLVFLTGSILLAAAATASAEEASWTLRFHGALIESSSANEANFDRGVSSSVDVGGGLGVEAEYRISHRVGLDFSALVAGLEIGSSASNKGVEYYEMGMTPLTLAVPFHFDLGRRTDLFVAPTISLVRYSSIESKINAAGSRSDIGSDSDAAPGATLGIDVPFGNGRWAFSAGVRYIKTETSGVDIDPVIVTIGAAVRFGRR